MGGHPGEILLLDAMAKKEVQPRPQGALRAVLNDSGELHEQFAEVCRPEAHLHDNQHPVTPPPRLHHDLHTFTTTSAKRHGLCSPLPPVFFKRQPSSLNTCGSTADVESADNQGASAWMPAPVLRALTTSCRNMSLLRIVGRLR